MANDTNNTNNNEVSVEQEGWIQKKWRPMMGWTYMVTCMFDFIVAPVLWTIAQALFHGGVNSQWMPLTLQGAGLYHIAMGAVLGVSAWSRGQEKMTGSTVSSSSSSYSTNNSNPSNNSYSTAASTPPMPRSAGAPTRLPNPVATNKIRDDDDSEPIGNNNTSTSPRER